MTIGLRSKFSLEVSWHVSTRLLSEQQVEPGLSTEEWQELLSIRRELRPVWQLGSRSDKLVYAGPQPSDQICKIDSEHLVRWRNLGFFFERKPSALLRRVFQFRLACAKLVIFPWRGDK